MWWMWRLILLLAVTQVHKKDEHRAKYEVNKSNRDKLQVSSYAKAKSVLKYTLTLPTAFLEIMKQMVAKYLQQYSIIAYI